MSTQLIKHKLNARLLAMIGIGLFLLAVGFSANATAAVPKKSCVGSTGYTSGLSLCTENNASSIVPKSDGQSKVVPIVDPSVEVTWRPEIKTTLSSDTSWVNGEKRVTNQVFRMTDSNLSVILYATTSPEFNLADATEVGSLQMSASFSKKGRPSYTPGTQTVDIHGLDAGSTYYIWAYANGPVKGSLMKEVAYYNRAGEWYLTKYQDSKKHDITVSGFTAGLPVTTVTTPSAPSEQ
jgi:hypothetical protein